MKVFLSGNPALRGILGNGARQTDIDNLNVHIIIFGQEVVLYHTDDDVSAISLTKDDLQELLARLK